MRFLDLWDKIDDALPFWVNCNGVCTYYECKYVPELLEVDMPYFDNVEYITLDGDGVLTVELESWA